METRARYIIVGLFVLAVTVVGFGFVYWLHNSAGIGEKVTYRIHFENTVSGLRIGSAVLFNGTRVGEVTDLRLDPAAPRQITALMVIDRRTPVRSDTRVEIEVQGLLGSPSISLTGGSAAAPVLDGPGGSFPTLVADPEAGRDTMQTAREVLGRVGKLLSDNSVPLHNAIVNLDTFSSALARNSERLDQIVEGLVKLTGGSAKSNPVVYDLAAPRAFAAREKLPEAQLVIPEPTAVLALDTQRINPGWLEAQWSDNIPKLVHARIIQSFENANYMRVSRPADGLAADYQLLVDIRAFRLAASPQPAAEVELSAKIVNAGGKIVAAKLFSARSKTVEADVPGSVAAFSEAFGVATKELVDWTLESL